jgi:hypothetical protein
MMAKMQNSPSKFHLVLNLFYQIRVFNGEFEFAAAAAAAINAEE